MVIGTYARLADKHLETHQPGLFTRLKEENRLAEYLTQIQEQTLTLVEQRIVEIKQTIPVEMKNGAPSYASLLRREETARMIAEEEILPLMVFVDAGVSG